jgi:type IV pilus assembly protein PilO
MKKSNAAIGTLIDQRYLPLELKYKIALAVFLLLLPILFFFFVFFQPNNVTFANLSNQKNSLEKTMKEVKAKLQDRPKLQRELDDTTAIFEETSKLLPKDKEIPKLLADISQLGRTAGLDFQTFKPQADVPKDFYAEIPVDIDLVGPYHNVGFFFDQVSRLDRIVSVSNVKMGTPKKEGAEMVLSSNCKLITYRFTNVELPKENPKTKKK